MNSKSNKHFPTLKLNLIHSSASCVHVMLTFTIKQFHDFNILFVICERRNSSSACWSRNVPCLSLVGKCLISSSQRDGKNVEIAPERKMKKTRLFQTFRQFFSSSSSSLERIGIMLKHRRQRTKQERKREREKVRRNKSDCDEKSGFLFAFTVLLSLPVVLKLLKGVCQRK